MKGTFRIGGALAIGTVIVLGALYVKDDIDAESSLGTIAVAPGTGRAPLEARDSDSDGIQDWEESLQDKIFETIDVPPSTVETAGDEPYEPPTTFTGKFSEAFLQDYLNGKMSGQDFSDPSAFVGTAVQAIEQNTASKRHTRLELRIIPDSDESIRAYGNRVADIIRTYSISNENEAVILERALTANDPKILDQLTPILTVYVNTTGDTLRMDVPESLALSHLNLVNAYEGIIADIQAMQVAFTDPLLTLARVKKYEADAQALFDALQSIAVTLKARGVTYLNDEPGAFFYMFDI